MSMPKVDVADLIDLAAIEHAVILSAYGDAVKLGAAAYFQSHAAILSGGGTEEDERALAAAREKFGRMLLLHRQALKDVLAIVNDHNPANPEEVAP